MAEPGRSEDDGPVVFLDIGATLVGADVKGPASRIGALLGLDGEGRRALRGALMTTDFWTPEEVAAHLVVSLGAEPEAAARASREIWESQRADARPLPGAPEALARLAAEGCRLGLISNIWRPYLESVRSHYGALFDDHVEPRLQLFSFQVGAAKPGPGIFTEALRRAGVGPERAVMVGDSYDEDVAPAAALGMRTVWVLTRPEDQAEAIGHVEDGAAPPPTFTVDSLDALDPRLLSCADG
ncbi:MAG TPA: HAD family hydrolase [Allosphingosinicella sp.]